MKSRDENGNYFVHYILQKPPAGKDQTVWGVAVREYLSRQGVHETTDSTVVRNFDFPEAVRIYNRLLGEGKQRRNEDSTPSPGPFSVVEKPKGPQDGGCL